PARLKDGTMPPAFGDPFGLGWRYGMGWVVSSDRGHTRVGHEGGAPGVIALLSRLPQEEYTVILLVNRIVEPYTLMRGVDRLYRPRQGAADREPRTTQRLRQVLLRLEEGEAAPTEFTAEAYATLLSELPEVRAFYRSLGLLR